MWNNKTHELLHNNPNLKIDLREGYWEAMKPVMDEYSKRIDEAVIKAIIEDGEKEIDPNGLDQHSPGAKVDSGKAQLSLVFGGFSNALYSVGEVGTFGATKYSPSGWKSVPNAKQRYLDAGLRHIFKYMQGEYYDDDSGLEHLAHAAWNVLAVLQFDICDTVPLDEDVE